MTKPKNAVIEKRMEIMKTFLSNYKKSNFKAPENYDEEVYRKWEEVQETGLKFKEFYYCMCGEPQILKLGENPLSEGSMRIYLKKANYRYDESNYIYKGVSDARQSAFDRIYDCLEYNICKHVYIVGSKHISMSKTENNVKDADYVLKEYCIVVSFESNELLNSIAEAISYAYASSVQGVLIGVGMIRIYCNSLTKAKKISKIFEITE